MLSAVIGTVLLWGIGAAAVIPVVEWAEKRFESNGVDMIDLGILFVFATALTVADTVALNLFVLDIPMLVRVIGQIMTGAVVLGGYSLFIR